MGSCLNARRLKAIWLFFLVIMSSCQASPRDDELNGRVALWHSWPDAEAAVLEEALAEFQEIHPNVRIVTVSLPEDRILEEFEEAGRDGLGPGMLIGSDSWIGELVDLGLIRPLSEEESTAGIFNERNRALTQNHGQLYGVPLSLAPRALYYNRSLVSQPPETLDALLQEAAAGNHVAFVPRFEEAYWGVQAFGKSLFNDEGAFTLVESGFAEWLGWLDDAQQAQGMILNVDDESLLELFTTGQVAYYIAGPEKLGMISAMISEGNPFEFGVVPLPSGPHGPAGPLLPADTIMLYAYASPAQTRISGALAAFLVNQQQSIRFMRESDRVPANPAVAVDRRIYPIVNGFARQASTAIVIPNEIPAAPLVAAGNRAYVSVLSGALNPAEAVCRFGQEVADFEGYSAADASLPQECEPLD